jgi:peptidoglycan hydrolase-like protein with peptidoglycan-binding domain
VASQSCERGTVGWCPNAYYRFGDTGTAITKMQEALKQKSFDVDVTGKFDDRTKKAIESFQKQHNIFKDGIAGPETLGKLKQ